MAVISSHKERSFAETANINLDVSKQGLHPLTPELKNYVLHKCVEEFCKSKKLEVSFTIISGSNYANISAPFPKKDGDEDYVPAENEIISHQDIILDELMKFTITHFDKYLGEKVEDPSKVFRSSQLYESSPGSIDNINIFWR